MEIEDMDPSLLESSLFKMIVIMVLSTYLTNKDKNKQILKMARKFQRGSSCKITRDVMERICQYKGRTAEATRETYHLLVTGQY